MNTGCSLDQDCSSRSSKLSRADGTCNCQLETKQQLPCLHDQGSDKSVHTPQDVKDNHEEAANAAPQALRLAQMVSSLKRARSLDSELVHGSMRLAIRASQAAAVTIQPVNACRQSCVCAMGGKRCCHSYMPLQDHDEFDSVWHRSVGPSSFQSSHAQRAIHCQHFILWSDRMHSKFYGRQTIKISRQVLGSAQIGLVMLFQEKVGAGAVSFPGTGWAMTAVPADDVLIEMCMIFIGLSYYWGTKQEDACETFPEVCSVKSMRLDM